MAISKYTIGLLVALMGLPLTSTSALGQEELQLDPAVETELNGEDVDSSSKTKKKKKKKKSAKGKDAADTDDKATDTKEVSKVAEALKKFKFISGKPNLKAEYYIYMYSASWCGYCKMCMPSAVKEYKKIRSSKQVEFILINGDKSKAEAIAYMKEYKAKMPCIAFDDLKATNFMGLPGCGMPGFPAISIADKNGKQIISQVGASKVKEVLENWRDYTIKRKNED
ncbi:MAG: redoxin domain-containing protein [Akkermansia sp.]|nr:redoxin domain-containing protein [Akkermansia sp.]